MPPDPTAVTVVISNYNGGDVLMRTVERVRAVLGERVPTIISDDGSSDGSAEAVQRRFPDVRVVTPGGHTARLNVVRNVGIKAAATRYAFLLDNDILVMPGCFEELMGAITRGGSVLCCTPRLLDHEDRTRIYADGNFLHFLGLSGASKRNRPLSETPIREPEQTFGGGIMLIDLERAAEIGYFDEGFAIGWADDAEFQMRGRLIGLDALHVSTANCVHASKDHGTKRSYGQFYNRYRLLLISYSLRALLLLSPPLVTFELALTALGLAMGISAERFRALHDIWRDRRDICARRKVVQSTRRVSDAKILRSGGIELAGPMGRSGAFRALTRFMTGMLSAYWRIVRPLL